MSTRLVTVLDGQTLTDIAIQEYGTVEGTEQLVKDNPNIVSSVTDTIVVGDQLLIDEDVEFEIPENVEELIANEEYKVFGNASNKVRKLVFRYPEGSVMAQEIEVTEKEAGPYNKVTADYSYTIEVNGNAVTMPLNVNAGDMLKVDVTKPIDVDTYLILD